MTNQPALDDVFHALADPTRRAVLARLAHGTAAVSELAAPFEMALPSFLQHLKVLERSSLVRSHKEGRVRTYELSPAPLRAAESFLVEQRGVWDRRLDSLDSYLETLKKAQSAGKEKTK